MTTRWTGVALVGIAVFALLMLGGCPASLEQTGPLESQLAATPADSDHSEAQPVGDQVAETDGGESAANAPADDPNSVLPRLSPPKGDTPSEQEPVEDWPDWPWDTPSPGDEPPPVPTDPPDGDPPGELTEPEPPAVPVDQAVDETAEQIIYAAAALNPFQALSDSRFHLRPFEMGEYGVCPTVRWATSYEWALLAIDYELDGCSSPATIGLEYAGNVGMIVDRLTRLAWAEYCYFLLDGRAVTGRLDAYITSRPIGVAVSGPIRVETEGIGSTAGDVLLDCDQSGWLNFSTGRLVLGNDEHEYATTPIELTADPRGNGNFVPEFGVLRFDLTDVDSPGEILHVAVTYTAQWPIDGTVLVTINNEEPYEHQIPDLGP